MSYTALILAGGLSSRCRYPKALIEYNGMPIILRIIDELKNGGFKIYISIKRNAISSKPINNLIDSLKAYVSLIYDCYNDIYHPLVGIYSFSKIYDSYFITLACDMPLIGYKSCRYLLDIAFKNRVGAVIPIWPTGYIEPLYAVYNGDICRSVITEDMLKSNISMRGFIKKIEDTSKVIYVPVSRLFEIEARTDIFTNINKL